MASSSLAVRESQMGSNENMGKKTGLRRDLCERTPQQTRPVHARGRKNVHLSFCAEWRRKMQGGITMSGGG